MKRTRVAWAIASVGSVLVIVAVVAAILVSATNTADIKTTQLEGTPTGKKLLEASERILDCTDPEGQCYRDSQERTASAVGDINRVIVLAAACAVGLDPESPVAKRQIEIQNCVIQRLAVAERKP